MGSSEMSNSRELRRKTRELKKQRTCLNQVLLGFISFCQRFISFYQRFISFYQCFIQGFSKAKPLTLTLKTTPTQSAKNSPSSMDRAEDAEVGSGTSSTTRSAENLPASVDMAKDAEVGGNGDGGDDETVKKITFQKVERTYGVSYLPILRR